MRAGFDWRHFGRDVRSALKGRALRGLADQIGVTATDMSRASSGANVGVEKVFAICDGLGLRERNYYLAPEQTLEKARCCTSPHVEQEVSDARGEVKP